MTDKELRKLRRTDLLELLIAQGREQAQLQQQLTQAQEALSDRELKISQAGTLADAAVQLNDLLGAAQRTVEQYSDNVNRQIAERDAQSAAAHEEAMAHAAQVVADADERAQWQLTAARDQAAQILQEAHREATRITKEAADQAAQIRADAQKEKESIIAQARKEAAGIKAKAAPAPAPEPQPAAGKQQTKSPLWKRNKKA